ncbi:MAG TPA: molybdopterin-dependent oxidoreductase [Bacillota bacterium]|jgi:DMSO/TMAO reductase YedYZ molybdopterin-dependent catalytic subunit|nr:molybdopterin-dependent oxidoreductase [Bacillota bacterium]
MKKTVLIVVVILALVVGVTAYMNRGDLAAKRESQQDAYVLIKSGGSEAVRIDLEKLKQMNVVDVEANLKRSGKPAEKHVYTGVLLKEVLEEAGVDTAGKDTVIMKAVDGYTSAIGMEETLQDDNVYLVFKMDGEPLGTKEEGGSGPLQVIIAKDPFSQRWCKFVMEIELQ